MRVILPLTCGLILALISACSSASTTEEFVADDTFVLRYQVDVPPDASPQLIVWAPVPVSDGVQAISLLSSPSGSSISAPDSFGNQFASVTNCQAETLVWEYQISRKIDNGGLLTSPPSPDFLAPNRLVPVGGEAAKRAALAVARFADATPTRALYNRVLEDMRYDKSGSGWGTGSTDWACEEGYGNCTDFHALFISMARSLKIPARFTIGFPIPSGDSGEVKGYHCWAHFWDKEKGWVPVDISEADKHPEKTEFFFGSLDASRVSFSYGRDLVLTPAQQGPPLNYFVKAYAEANGQPVKVATKVSFKR